MKLLIIEDEKELAEKRHQEQLVKLEANLKNCSKLKLTPQNINLNQKQRSKQKTAKQSKKEDDDDDSDDSDLCPENLVINDSESPNSNDLDEGFSEFNQNQNDNDEEDNDEDENDEDVEDDNEDF